ncbi:MAG TPA: hypothetical protein PLP33_19695 [Leptospiraceae bacterium]|nr:hypothetical protein [Leptospiraceae bacterium]
MPRDYRVARGREGYLPCTDYASARHASAASFTATAMPTANVASLPTANDSRGMP